MNKSVAAETNCETTQNYIENESWRALDCINLNNDFDLLIDKIIANKLSEPKNVFRIKIIVEKDISELCSINLKKLQQRFKNKSIVIFIAAKDEKEFLIYWKLKDIRQVLFLKPYKESFSENDKYVCECAAEFLANSLQNGRLGIHPDHDISIKKGKIELHSLIDCRNYNLLLFACEIGNAKPIEALLKYGLKSQLLENDVTAQNLAWQGRYFGVVLKLLQANFPFPPSVDIRECSEELKGFIGTCEEFHKMIEAKNKDRLDEMLKENPNLRYFYNLLNESALKVAMELKLMEIYEFLLSKNLKFAPHEDVSKIISDLSQMDKDNLYAIHIKHGMDLPENYINVLMSNTSIIHDETNEEEKLELVKLAYKKLNKDPRLKIILKIVAATKIFSIVFDFLCKSTSKADSASKIDPTVNACSTETFQMSTRIVIAAKQLLDTKTEHETFGTLAHELCHYVLHVVYKNKGNPYTKLDREAEKKFHKILNACKRNKDREEIISNVYENYGKNEQSSELIVRIAHLIAMYLHHPEILEGVIGIFPEFFDYFDKIVVAELERILPEIEGRSAYKPSYSYSKLSSQNKVNVQNAEVIYKNVKVRLSELFPKNSEIYDNLKSENISQILKNDILNFDDPQLRYLEEQINFEWENLPTKFKEKFLDSNLNFQNQVISFRRLNYLYPEAFFALSTQQIINILSGEKFVVGKKVESDLGFYVERKFIPEDAQLIRFEYEYGHAYVEGSGTPIENRTNDKTFQKFCNEFLEQKFDNCSQILDKVKQNLVFKIQTYNLNQVTFYFMHKNSDEIIEQAEKEKILILSSETGAGKSATLKHLAIKIKYKFPTRWVFHIDLKDVTKFYKSKETVESEEDLLNKILGLSSAKSDFEVRIFGECSKSNNVVFIWDGFDKISSVNYERILNLIKFVHNNTKNVQLVCTRPVYSHKLRKIFEIRTWQLLPFDEDKHEFLKGHFAFQKVSNEKIEENIKKVDEIIEKFNSNLVFIYKFDTPWVLKLFSGVHGNELNFTHIYRIFDSFVEKKIEFWKKSALSVPKMEPLSSSIKLILQKYALLNEFVIFANTTLGLKMRKLQIMQIIFPQDISFEDILGMEILIINGKNNFEFSHKTIAEFFVAQYFIENVYEVAGDIPEDEAELRLELFFYLMQNYGNLQQTITDFMNSCVKTSEDKNFNPTISRLLRTKFRKFFIRMLDTNHPKVFEFLFQFFKKDHNLLVDLLHVNENETFYTAIFNPNYFAIFVNPEEIKSLGRNCLTDEEFEKFLNGKNQRLKILYGMHFYSLLDVTKSNESYDTEIQTLSDLSYWGFLHKYMRPHGFIQKIFGNSEEEILAENELKELLVTALSPKIYLFYDQIFSEYHFRMYKKLWSQFGSMLSKTELQNVIGDAFIHYFEICPEKKVSHDLYLILLLKKAKKFLTNSQIYEIFTTKHILHESFWDGKNFRILWDFLNEHTSDEEQRKILLQNGCKDKNFYFFGFHNELKDKFSSHKYVYYYYDFTPFKILHRAINTTDASAFYSALEIYHKYFEKKLLQEIILSSNDFFYYVIGTANKDSCLNFLFYLGGLFNPNKEVLVEFLEQKIEPTNCSCLEFVEYFRELPGSKPKWFNNLQTFRDLDENLKINNNLCNFYTQ